MDPSSFQEYFVDKAMTMINSDLRCIVSQYRNAGKSFNTYFLGEETCSGCQCTIVKCNGNNYMTTYYTCCARCHKFYCRFISLKCLCGNTHNCSSKYIVYYKFELYCKTCYAKIVATQNEIQKEIQTELKQQTENNSVK